MEADNIKADVFLPGKDQKKAKKRSANEETDLMQVDEATVIEGTAKSHAVPQPKRNKSDIRKIEVPPHRFSYMKEHLMKIFTPVVEEMMLQICFNTEARQVELRISPETPDISNLQKGADFVKAFLCGFEVDDALTLLRLEDIFVESLEIKDIKTGDHTSRVIGRLTAGRTKFTVEDITKTRIVVDDSKIHFLGSYQNIQLAKRAICSLILGSPPYKVYANLRSSANRFAEKMHNLMEVNEATGIEGTGKSHTLPRATQTKSDTRKIGVPPHKFSSLKEHWMKIFTPVVEEMKLQIRFDTKARQVELHISPETPNISNLQKGANFVKAFLCGFEVDDALALLRLEDIFVESLEIMDVKTLKEDHISRRAIDRLAGKSGRTLIENVTKTRIIVAHSKIHVLGRYQNIQLAKRAVCNLIIGSPPNKVYTDLRSVASRLAE